jgi:light-regulated signal transduction histidine kinase (bacteriophytochrome)
MRNLYTTAKSLLSATVTMEKTPYVEEVGNTPQHQSRSISAFEYADFTDLAVHDLDAPLRKLAVLIEMLASKVSADKDARAYINRIENCVGDMRSLIDDLSILGKVNSEETEFVPCAIDEVIQQALRDMPAAIKEKNAVITAFSLPTIEGDPGQFSRLFKILLENAIKFSKSDTPPEIHIRSSILSSEEKGPWHLPDDRHYYKMEIDDNGIGFKNEYAEKIFRPFIRLHGKSQFPGNGIGLAICKKIMDIHHGIIYAESRENEGAKFILLLPESH